MQAIKAPAKINLTLEIMGSRPDGYHEIRSIMQTLSLCDNMIFEENDKTTITCDKPEWSADKGLVSKAITLIRGTTGCEKGVNIRINKNIPTSAGLGGDSSAAAATLLALNNLWELKLPKDALLKMATELGSDVTFFLYGGTALCEGRGEIVETLPEMPKRWVVVIMPKVTVPPEKTKTLYGSLKKDHYSFGLITSEVMKEMEEGILRSSLTNDFEEIAFKVYPELQEQWKQILDIGADNLHLAGSGPALFSLLEENADAETLYQLLGNKGFEVYFAQTSG